jgi:UDP-N-acetylmuramoyl-L-alanyl-D-glutamate--2,6-diaminopimelate ligase
MLAADLLSQLRQRKFSLNIWPAQPQLLELEIAQACFDSRRVSKGDLFCALDGSQQQGNDFLQAAIDAGASMLLLKAHQPQLDFPQLVIADDALLVAAHCADILAGQPSSKMWCAAITGTNGKTTIAHLLRGAMQHLKMASASCGTLGLISNDVVLPNLNTTPSADIIQSWMASLVADGCEALIIEASSHGIVQQRVAAIDFDCVGFTNLSQEHLDYHHTLENYAHAKMQLVNQLPATAVAFIPYDKALLELSSAALAQVHSWSSHDSNADYFCNIETTDRGVRVAFEWDDGMGVIDSELCGYFNGENLFLAALMLLSKGLALEAVCQSLSVQDSADGRMQQVSVHRGRAFVDYAHTPDAQLKVVFGAGGDRDPSKRALMGAAVSEHADWCVLTSDNPRTESASAIVEQVKLGVDQEQIEFHCIVERAAAIRSAVESLKDNDVLVIAGKGHETYQEIDGVRNFFDDRLQIIEAVQCLA